jgi:hypothetical protein
MAYGCLAVFVDIWIKTNDIHIPDFLPFMVMYH